MWAQAIATSLLFMSIGVSTAQQRETLFMDVNAYDPLPSPDGKRIAYVVTGRKPMGGSGGFGRSNLLSQIEFAAPNGAKRQGPNVEGFLGEWLSDSSGVVSYRDWRFSLVGPSGKREGGSMLRGDAYNSPPEAERVAYISSLRTFIWIDHSGDMTLLQTPHGPIASLKAMLPLSALIIPSPDGRYLAVGGITPYQWEERSLWIFDTMKETWTNLGSLTIHPDPDWDYIKPNWNPWFSHGNQLAFFSGPILYVVSPDGTRRRKLLETSDAGLAVPSPDGSAIAYVTYSPRPRKLRPDLKFWGGSTVWLVATSGGNPKQVTGLADDETYDLRWLTEASLIFDRVGDHPLLSAPARIWTVPVDGK